MIAYVFLAPLAGILGGLFGLWRHGVEPGHILLGYVTGGWACVALILGAVLLNDAFPPSPQGRLL